MSRLRVLTWLRVLAARIRLRDAALRAVVLTGLAGCGLGMAAPPGDQEATRRAAREGIWVLSPVQSLPVAPAVGVPFRELPLDPMPCEMLPAEGLKDASVREVPQSASATLPTDASEGKGAVAADEADRSLAASPPSGAQAAALPIECAHLFPSIAPVREQPYSFGLETLDPELREPVVLVTHGHPSTRPWFSALGSQQGFFYSGGQWTYRDAVGPTFSMGNLTAPNWGSTVALGGLQVASGWDAGTQTLPEGGFAYNSVVGRLNYTDIAAQAGAIDYGVTAGSGSLRYGLVPGVTLESQVQSAPNMVTQGVGTTYAAGDLGTFRLGATQSTFNDVNAWRYRFGYHVSLADSVDLAVTNEQIGAGFGDLSQYRSGAIGTPIMRNTLVAGVPLHGWGTLTGTYSGTEESGVATERRFGLEHSMLVAPNVRLAVGADRDVITGDYGMRAGISMPVDTFMHGRWLPW